MFLESIKLVNFRQFYGETRIEFSRDIGRNITLVHGENGVGKTTILNALLWCLFGKLTADFERPEDLISKQALSENIESCRVEVEFEYENDAYVAQRTLEKRRKEAIFKIHKIENENNYVEVPNSWGFINSVLPSNMAEYFFFHGEGISNISYKQSGAKFRRSIRDILGFTYAETAIEDLKHIRTKWTKLLAELLDDNKDLAKAANRRADLEEELIGFEELLKEHKEKSDNYKDHYERVINTLVESKHVDASKLQTGITKLTKEKEGYEGDLKLALIEKKRFVHHYGYAVFGNQLASQRISLVDELDSKGKVPSPYDAALVNELIEEKKCICGRELLVGTDPYSTVLSMLTNANTSNIKDRVRKARSISDKMKSLSREFVSEAERIEEKISNLHRLIGAAEGELKLKNDELNNIPTEEIKKLNKQKEELLSKIEKAAAATGSIKITIFNTKEEIDGIKRLLEQKGGADQRIVRLTNSQNLVQIMIDRLEEILQEYENNARQDIKRRVNAILDRFSRKEYQVQLSENFEFNLIRKSGEIVAKSKGENLLLNLAFVSSLINIANERISDKNELLVSGSTAPFVIDAPFGELDDTYKAATAEFLPSNVNQLILLLSSSHWKGTVDEAIKNRVGREYVLLSHKKTERGQKPLDEIVINGKKIQQSFYSTNVECTTVQEIN